MSQENNGLYDFQPNKRNINKHAGVAESLKEQENKASDSARDSENFKENLGSDGLYKKEKDSSISDSSQKSMKMPQKMKNIFWGTKKRKIATSSTGIVGSIVSVVFSMIFLAAGPAQLIQLSNILGGDLSTMDGATSLRYSSLLRYSGSQDIGETRLGVLGKLYLRPQLKAMEDIGVTFNTNSSGGLKSTTIDTEKYTNSISDVKGYTPEELRSYLADNISGLNLSEITNNGDGTLTIGGSSAELTTSLSRSIVNSFTDDLPSSKILTAMTKRVFKDYFDAPSLFHPYKVIKSKTRQAITKITDKAEEEKSVKEDVVDPEAQATNLTNIKSNLDSFFKDSSAGKAITKALLITAFACTIRSAAKYVVEFNRAAIVLPAALEAVRLVSAGNQVESGQNVSLSQVGATVGSFVNSSGQSIWSAKSLQVTANMANPSGPNLPTQYAQAFSGKTTANNIINGMDAGGAIVGFACSPIGQVIQGLTGLIALLSAVPTDGTSLAGFYAVKGTELGTTMVLFMSLQKILEKVFEDKAVVPAVLSGPLGGNLMAYGAREAGNMGARSEGGVALSSSDTQKVVAYDQSQSKKQFSSQDFFARIFNIDSNNSLFGKLADYIQPSIKSVGDTFLGLFNFGHIFSGIVSSILPKASAASTPYNWEFPLYGIPSSILDSSDPTMQNPYANANEVSQLLNTQSTEAQNMINRANTCFGVSIEKISGQWSVIPQSDVNPDTSSYINADCNNLSDNNWQRIILFVLDSRTMDAYACYRGNQQSCSNTGF